MLGKTPLPRNFFKPKSRPVHCITLSARSLTRFVVHPFSRPFDVIRDDFGPKVTGLAEENGFEMAVASRQNSNVAHRTHQDRQLRFHREESGVAKFWREVLICQLCSKLAFWWRISRFMGKFSVKKSRISLREITLQSSSNTFRKAEFRVEKNTVVKNNYVDKVQRFRLVPE